MRKRFFLATCFAHMDLVLPRPSDAVSDSATVIKMTAPHSRFGRGCNRFEFVIPRPGANPQYQSRRAAQAIPSELARPKTDK